MVVARLVFFALLAFLPAGLANMAPVFAAKAKILSFLDKPIDCGISWRKRRIFGANKTWRGFVAGFVLALVGVFIQRVIDQKACIGCYAYSQPFTSINPIWLAFLYSFGALGGDAIESFFKRQIGKKPGSSWFPFDQLDFIVGALATTWPVLHYSHQLVTTIVLVMLIGHVISTVIGYHLGLKDKPI